MIAKLPAMDDKALAVLRSNAERLSQTGTKSQKTAAAALLPAIDAEVDARKTAKLGQGQGGPGGHGHDLEEIRAKAKSLAKAEAAAEAEASAAGALAIPPRGNEPRCCFADFAGGRPRPVRMPSRARNRRLRPPARAVCCWV